MRIIFTLLFCYRAAFCFSQTDTLRAVCFAKCYVLTFEQEEDFVLPAWGNEDEVFNIRMISKKEIDKPMSTRWIKKKAERDCLSANPEDCVVWCEVKVPATYQITKDYIDETPEDFSTEEFFRTRFETGFLNAIQKKKRLNAKTKEALKSYQLKHGLPLGNLDLETLEALGINY